MKGDKAHAFNAITATFTLALGALVRSCANRLDCSAVAFNGTTTDRLDINPAVLCTKDNYTFVAMAAMAGDLVARPESSCILCAYIRPPFGVASARAGTAARIKALQSRPRVGVALRLR